MQDQPQTPEEQAPEAPTHVEKLVYFQTFYGDKPSAMFLYDNDLRKAPRGFRIFKVRIPLPPKDQWEFEQPDMESLEASVEEVA